MKERLTKRLTIRYVVVLAVLAVLAVAAYAMLERVISDNASSAAEINVSGRQRMLSQRVALLADMYVGAATAEERRQFRAALRNAIIRMETGHKALIQGSSSLDLPGEPPPQVRRLYFGPEGTLDADLRAYLAHVRALVDLPVEALSPDHPDLVALRAAAVNTILPSLEAVVSAYQREAENRVARLQRLQILAVSLTLVVLMLSAGGVFHPLIRRINQEMGEQEAAQRRLRGILHSVTDGIITFDENGHIRSFNPAAEHIFGLSGSEALGGSIEDMIHFSTPGMSLEKLVGSKGFDGACRTEVMGVRAGGRHFPAELSVTEMRLEGQRQFTAVVRDISDRKRAEAHLQLAAAVFENSLHGIVITDVDTRIIDVNRAFTALTGYPREEVIGQPPSLLSSGRHDEYFYQAMWASLSEYGQWQGEIWNKRKNGQVYPEHLEISAVRNDKGEVTNYIGLFTDLTKMKLADAKLAEYAEELETRNVELRAALFKANEANRAKSEFLATMSHELRTPLNAIIGFSEAMLMKVFGPIGNKRYHEYMESIHDSGRHLLKVIDDILDVSKVEAESLELNEESVDLGACVESSVRLVGDRARQARVTLDVSIPPGLERIWADERRVRQILLNLLSNAIKFTPEGGRVGIRVERGADGGMVLAVSDTGIGISEEDIPKAMSPFGQVDSRLARKYEGTGLGLPLTKGLIEMHDGRLELASVLGEGTTVTVHFPAERVLNQPDRTEAVNENSVTSA